MDTESIKAIKELFILREDCYAKQKDGLNEYWVVKQHFSEQVIEKHLAGDITVGSFQIDNRTNNVKWICFDFDGDLNIEFEKAKSLYRKLKNKGYSPLIEFSGRRGYHVWLFVEPVKANDAKRFAEEISKGIEVSDIYPKQEKIDISAFGGQVKLPLGIHRVSNKRSYFLDEKFRELDIEKSIELINEVFSKKRDKITTVTLTDLFD